MTDEAEAIELRIAKLLGYRALVEDGVWDIVDPDGKTMYCESHSSEKGAWSSAILHYGPEWARHADAALELPLDHLLFFDLHGCSHRDEMDDKDEPLWYARVDHRLEEYLNGGFTGMANTPAEAICRAWLAWRDPQRRAGESDGRVGGGGA